MVCVEEPETHLFPSGQRNIVELMAIVLNANGGKGQFVITTHSPYILTAFNNLIQAGALAEQLPKTKLRKLHQIVPKACILSPSDLRAYALQGGTQKCLKDPETGLISADVIDEVSENLDAQFGNLLEML